jgi:hypothetical protein|tara:strand:- start:297 stop:689 length:393 start_codon:yes stop_codon:yes gene_type:complete
MTSEPPESGLDELMRLSRQTVNEGKELDRKEQQRLEQRQVVQGALKGLREIGVTVTVEQLKQVATPEIIEEVDSLKYQQGTEGLRRLITRLANDLEKCVDDISASNPDMVPIQRSVKTLVILLELLSSIQ